MQQLQVSQRLAKIASFVPRGCRIADIGSDHAQLPVYLLQTGTVSFAVAGELNIGPLRAAERQVVKAGLTQSIAVRQGNGLEVIEAPDRIDAVVIAGMGGNLICSILENGIDKLETVQHLIVQPNVGEEAVRRWLYTHGWFLAEEAILKEDGRIYEILYAVRCDERQPTNEKLYDAEDTCLPIDGRAWKFRFGPWLLFQNDPLLVEKWLLEHQKWQFVLQQLAQSQSDEADAKKAELQEKMRQLEAILACLQADRPCYS